MRARCSAGGEILDAARRDLLGFRTAIVEYDLEDSHTTEWRIPELDCTVIRQIDEFHRASREVVTDRLERTPVSIEIGEPDPAWFEIPEDYKEMTPSELRRARAEWRGQAVPEDKMAAFRKRDGAYL